MVLAIGGLFFALLALCFAFTVLALALKALIWLVLLPFRLAMWVIAAVMVLPLLLIGGILLGVGLLVAIITPLLPLLVFGVLVWGLVRLIQGPASRRPTGA